MQKIFLNAKIHRATVTSKNVEYEGSITIDSSLIEAVGIEEGELVQVVNVNNGARFETYVIRGEENSGIISLNGAAARLGEIGDKVIIMAYALFDLNERHNPKVIVLDSQNKINRVL
jgi:aspartate 1-decarboxylase|uniref:Aspartate 1-decarboxylase n=1 Tax=Mesoaciditoga lauensis TaxID=1495039 RepID=A0A7V3RFG8_9BACT